MKKILTLNNISPVGLERLPLDQYEISSESSAPDAILLRSFKMHDMEVPSTLKAVGRAGAGTNNIPVDKMTGLGIPVFNAPGANANAVKELTIAGMLLAARNICPAWNYVCELEGDNAKIAKDVEAGKKTYGGFELPGRTLGVIGLGAIGVMVANCAKALGMNVVGFDPQLTVRSAWQLSSAVMQASGIDDLVTRSDFITFHVPLNDHTRGLINRDRIEMMKDGVVILNFSRGEVVDEEAMLEALESGKVHAYVTDFPTKELKNHPKVIGLPHLGASTGEAEDNCAIMVADQVKDFLENGNIINSVNFPELVVPRAGKARLTVVNKNVPNMVGQISTALADAGLNIADMTNKSRGDIAYSIVDVESDISDETVAKIEAIEGIVKVRVI